MLIDKEAPKTQKRKLPIILTSLILLTASVSYYIAKQNPSIKTHNRGETEHKFSGYGQYIDSTVNREFLFEDFSTKKVVRFAFSDNLGNFDKVINFFCKVNGIQDCSKYYGCEYFPIGGKEVFTKDSNLAFGLKSGKNILVYDC